MGIVVACPADDNFIGAVIVEVTEHDTIYTCAGIGKISYTLPFIINECNNADIDFGIIVGGVEGKGEFIDSFFGFHGDGGTVFTCLRVFESIFSACLLGDDILNFRFIACCTGRAKHGIAVKNG